MRSGNGGSGPGVGPMNEMERGAPLLSLAVGGAVELLESGSVSVAMVTFLFEVNTNYVVVVVKSTHIQIHTRWYSVYRAGTSTSYV